MAEIRRNPFMQCLLSAVIAVACLTRCFAAQAPIDAQSLHKSMIAWFEEKLEKAQVDNNYKEMASDLLLLASTHSVPGEEKQAVDCYTRALPLLRLIGDQAGEAKALSSRARLYSGMELKQLALEDFNQALMIQRSTGDRSGQGETLREIAAVYSDLGQKQKERDYLGQAAKLPPPRRNPPPIISPEPPPQSSPSYGTSAQGPAAAGYSPQFNSSVSASPPAERTTTEAERREQAAQAKAAERAANKARAQEEQNLRLAQSIQAQQPPHPPPAELDHTPLTLASASPAGSPPGASVPFPPPPTPGATGALNPASEMPEPNRPVNSERSTPDAPAQAEHAQAVAELDRARAKNEQEQAQGIKQAAAQQPQQATPAEPDSTADLTPLPAERAWIGSDPTDRDSKAAPLPASNLPPVERYPNIEAPDTVSVSQEIAVQVSLTAEQISPETKVLSGAQNQGKVQLQMAEGERQWTLTVNLTAPGMEITRGGANTAEITINREGDSTFAAFYMRALPLPPSNTDGKRDTRIFATLWHNGAFLARIARPLTILAPASQATAGNQAPAPSPVPVARPMFRSLPPSSVSPHPASTALNLDPAIVAPDLTIVENRVGSTLRIIFFPSGSAAPVEADITNPDELHDWINAHFSQMANRTRAITPEPPSPEQARIDRLHAYDHLNAFGAELYDRFAPPAFKTLFFDLLSRRTSDRALTIQILSDDPSLPWELMRPTDPDSNSRMDFLGATYWMARWPLSRRGSTRPPQSLTVERSVVIAPTYRGTQSLAAANQELATLKSIRGFTQVAGDYESVRNLAGHPPQGIVHFAGHGQVSEEHGVPRFAILLEDSEMDPATWQALGTAAGATHPLFFFNACDVGESRQFMNDVDGWAPALLGNGASGYIGALWPVKDSTAALFASTFYAFLDKSLATGHYLNVASLLAHTRAQVFRETGDATALAYVFYGDPRLVLAMPLAKQ
jgi:tetratricopeptide (TPR) repeat protein